MNQQLLDFIKRQLESGHSREDITRTLISQGGWTETEVKDAFASFAAPTNTAAAQSIGTPPSTPLTQSASTTPAQATPTLAPESQPVAKPEWHGAQAPGVYKDTQTKSKGLRRSTTVTLIILFLLLAGGAAWAFFVYFPDLIKPKPEEALARSLQAFLTAPTVHIDSSIRAVGTFESAEQNGISASSSAESAHSTSTLIRISSTTPQSIKGDYNISLGLVSNIDRRDGGDPKVTLSLSPDISVKIPPLTFDISAVLDTRFIDRIFYVQLRSMTDLFFPIDFSRLKGVWIQFKPTDYNQYSSTTQEQLWQQLRTSGALVITQEFPTVKEDGVRYRHYAFTLDQAKFASLIADLNQIPGAATTTASFVSLPSPTGEIWIDSSTYFPHKLLLTYTIDGAQTDLSSGDTKLAGTVTFEAHFTPTIDEGSVVAPDNVHSFSDVMGLLSGSESASSTGSSTAPVR